MLQLRYKFTRLSLSRMRRLVILLFIGIVLKIVRRLRFFVSFAILIDGSQYTGTGSGATRVPAWSSELVSSKPAEERFLNGSRVA